MFFKKEKSVSFVSRVVEKKKDVHKRIEYPNQQVYHNISKNVFFLKKMKRNSPLFLCIIKPVKEELYTYSSRKMNKYKRTDQ